MSMWNTIANFRDNLSQIASEVLDTTEELEIGSAAHGIENADSSPKESLYRTRSQTDGNKYINRGRSSESLRDFARPRYANKDGDTNGVSIANPDFGPKLEELEMKCQNLEARGKELLNQLQAKDRAYMVLDGKCKRALEEAEKLKEALAEVQQNLSISNARLEKELENVEISKRTCLELEEENAKIRGLLRDLPTEKRNVPDANEARDEAIQRLEETLLAERLQFQAEMEQLRRSTETREIEGSQSSLPAEATDTMAQANLKEKSEQVDALLEKLKATEEAYAVEKAELSKRLDAVTLEKDKAISNLSRLKQHLLDKENADTEKMDRDSERIAALEAMASASSARVLHLEQALSQATANKMEMSKKNNDELQKWRSEVQSLEQKLGDCFKALESKETEVANLQTVLGQYYAESDAKERLEWELRAVKEDVRKLSAQLETERQLSEIKEGGRKEAVTKLELAEQKVRSHQERILKFEQDMARLRHALEESMIRLNRMSSDSDFSVDRRLVIKLLVTYFERNHSREVLDLMAKILGFSDDEKRRVGLAHQNAGKPGVVRSVLGLPGRVVGGLLSSGSEAPVTPRSSGNQSFADLWIDFLLKESEERDRKERQESEMKLGGGQGAAINGNGNILEEAFPSETGSSSKGHRRVYSTS